MEKSRQKGCRCWGQSVGSCRVAEAGPVLGHVKNGESWVGGGQVTACWE